MLWTLTDAKNKLTEVVNLALTEGPQEVSRRGDRVIIMARDEYERLTGKKPSFKQALMSGPDFDGLDLERDSSPMREVEL